MTMSNSDARKRKAESDVDLPATPGYIARLVRERDAARAEVAALREQIAGEIEAIPYSPELEHGDNGEWMQQEAARVAREGKP